MIHHHLFYYSLFSPLCSNILLQWKTDWGKMKYITPDTSNNKSPFKIAFRGHNLTNVTINLFFPIFLNSSICITNRQIIFSTTHSNCLCILAVNKYENSSISVDRQHPYLCIISNKFCKYNTAWGNSHSSRFHGWHRFQLREWNFTSSNI